MTRKPSAAPRPPPPALSPPPAVPAVPPDALLTRLLQVAPPVLARVYAPDSCIAATQLLCTLLPRLGYPATPCPVIVTIYNAAFVACYQRLGHLPTTPAETRHWADTEGAWWLGLGYPTGRNDPARWEGHLAALVTAADRLYLLDLTLGQATRPAYAVRLGPVLVPVPAVFARGRRPAVAAVNGCLVHYQGQPTNQEYRTAPDWCRPRPERLTTLQAQILAAL